MRRLFPLVVLLAACHPKTILLVSSDKRIDAANGATESTDTRMCVSGDTVSVVWADDREEDGHPQIWYNRSTDAGGTWAGPAKLSEGAVGAFHPEIACAGERVYVTWEDTRDGVLENGNIYVRSSGDGGASFGDEVALDDDPEGEAMSLEPQVVASGNDAFIAWFDGRSGAYDIYASGTRDGGDTWQPSVRVDGGNPGGGYSAHARLAYDGSVVYVAWEDSRTGDHTDIYFARSTDGALTFEDDVRVDKGDDAGGSDSFAPAIAASEGYVYIAWHDLRNGEGADVLMNWSDDSGEGFEEAAVAVATDTPGFFNSFYPQVLADGKTAHFVWEDARRAGFDIYYRKLVDGAFTAEEARLDTDGAGFGNSLQPRIAAEDDRIVVLWQDRRADETGVGYDELYYNWSEDGGATWGPDDRRVDSIKEGTHWAVDQTPALSGDRLLAAWTDGRSGNADVYFQNIALGEDAPYIEKEQEPEE